jgi:hypothetical protein
VRSLGLKINAVRSKDEFSLLECLGIAAIAGAEIFVVHGMKANNCLHCAIKAVSSSFIPEWSPPDFGGGVIGQLALHVRRV